ARSSLRRTRKVEAKGARRHAAVARVDLRHTILAADPHFECARREIGRNFFADLGARIRRRQNLDAEIRPGAKLALRAVAPHELRRRPNNVRATHADLALHGALRERGALRLLPRDLAADVGLQERVPSGRWTHLDR